MLGVRVFHKVPSLATLMAVSIRGGAVVFDGHPLGIRGIEGLYLKVCLHIGLTNFL